MSLLFEYEAATRDAEVARLRRVLSVRAMLNVGMTQREVAELLGVSQPAISYQVSRERTDDVRPSLLMSAGASIVRAVAQTYGFEKIALFGSAARGDDRVDSDVDLLVEPPHGATLSDLTRLEQALTEILGRQVDVLSARALDSVRDRDILRDARAI